MALSLEKQVIFLGRWPVVVQRGLISDTQLPLGELYSLGVAGDERCSKSGRHPSRRPVILKNSALSPSRSPARAEPSLASKPGSASAPPCPPAPSCPVPALPAPTPHPTPSFAFQEKKKNVSVGSERHPGKESKEPVPRWASSGAGKDRGKGGVCLARAALSPAPLPATQDLGTCWPEHGGRA